MPKPVSLLCTFVLLVLISACSRTGLKKYYTKISPEEFEHYESKVLKAQSKYGKIYHVFTTDFDRHKMDMLVLEKYDNGERSGLFKLDAFTEIKDDSTLMFAGPPLLITSDTVNWKRGLWFYSRKDGLSTSYSVDSMPPKPPVFDPATISPGIYHYQGNKLVKLTSSQTEGSFAELKAQGFFYLPNPGRFYMLANVNQIE